MIITEIITIVLVILKVFKAIQLSWLECFAPEIASGVVWFVIVVDQIIKTTIKKKR